MKNYEKGKQEAIELVAEIFERLENAKNYLEKAREEKNLVSFAYWFVLIHEFYYMLQKPLDTEELQKIYLEMDSYTHIDYLIHKRKQGYERLPDYHTSYGRGYNIPDIIGCALSNRYEEEIFTFHPDIKGCEGTLVRQNLMLHFLQTGENRQHVDYCDSCGRNLNDQPYPYTYRCTKCGRVFNLCAKCSKEQIHKSWGDVGEKSQNVYDDLIYRMMFQQNQNSLIQDDIDQKFSDKGILEFTEGGQVDARQIVSVVSTVLERIKQEYDYFYRKFLRKTLILYIYNNPNIRTLTVDECNNVYVNANYLYNTLNLNANLIFALFMNGVYRIDYHQFVDERKFLYRGMPKFTWGNGRQKQPVGLTRPLHHDLNIALDLQVNATLLQSEIIAYEILKNKMNAICVDNTNIGLISTYYYQNSTTKFRGRINLTFPFDPPKRLYPDSILAGYRQTRIRISKLVVNYGEAKVYEKIKLLIKHIRNSNLQ